MEAKMPSHGEALVSPLADTVIPFVCIVPLSAICENEKHTTAISGKYFMKVNRSCEVIASLFLK